MITPHQTPPTLAFQARTLVSRVQANLQHSDSEFGSIQMSFGTPPQNLNTQKLFEKNRVYKFQHTNPLNTQNKSNRNTILKGWKPLLYTLNEFHT